jgi:hypothetical protein
VLYWSTKPDPLFTKIVDVAISVGRDLVRSWEGSSPTEWATMYPELAKFFTPATSNRELERLRVTHGSSKVFRPGDYQWLLLFEVLRDFCEAYNDQPIDTMEHEGTVIRHIDFDAILAIFFWDLDFTIPLEELSALGAAGRNMMGIQDQAFNAAAGLVPHPDELALEEVTSPKWAEEDEAFFRAGSTTYPALLLDE